MAFSYSLRDRRRELPIGGCRIVVANPSSLTTFMSPDHQLLLKARVEDTFPL
jgi:hypothetical protein